jgi:CDP-6-deoxy-D-xylo-4-hexulose-3-dehydrase
VPIVCDNPKVKHALQQYLEKNGIQTRNYFAGNLLLHPAYKHLGNPKDYPNAYEVLKRVFFLGTSPTLIDSDLNYIKKILQDFMATAPIGLDGYSSAFVM